MFCLPNELNKLIPPSSNSSCSDSATTDLITTPNGTTPLHRQVHPYLLLGLTSPHCSACLSCGYGLGSRRPLNLCCRISCCLTWLTLQEQHEARGSTSLSLSLMLSCRLITFTHHCTVIAHVVNIIAQIPQMISLWV